MRQPFKIPLHVVVFLLPGVLIYSVFSAWPLIDTLLLSLYEQDDSGARHFVGLANYNILLFDEEWSKGFWNAMWNNLKFFIIHMVVQNPISLIIAALVSNRMLKGANTYRTLIFFPTLLSVVIVGFIWQLILNPLWGVSETLLGYIGLDEYFDAWLGLESTALISIALISVWQFVGIPLMLIYTALLGVPDELSDAAYVDGATPRQIFWKIKLPLILPTLGLVSILTFIGNFNAFDLIYSIKGGLAGPNFSTDILGTYFYRTFFGFQSSLGSPTMGATVAAMMFFVILVGVMVYFYLVQRKLQRYQM